MRTSGAAALQGETKVSTTIYEARAPNSLSVGSSEWGMVVATSYILCKLQGRDGNPERHPFCFYDTGSLHILYSLSEPNWCMVLGFVQPTTEGSTWDLFSYTSVGHTQIFIYASCTFICGIWGTTTRIRPSTLLVGIRWRKYKVIFIWGCKCLRFV